MFLLPEATNIVINLPDDRILLTKHSSYAKAWSISLEEFTSKNRGISKIVYEKLGLVVPNKSNAFMKVLTFPQIRVSSYTTVNMVFLKLLGATSIRVAKDMEIYPIRWEDLLNDIKFEFQFVEFETENLFSNKYTTSAIISARELYRKGIMK